MLPWMKSCTNYYRLQRVCLIPQSTSCPWIHLEVFSIWFGKQLLVARKALGEWQQEAEEGIWGVKAVCASQWVLPGRGDCRSKAGAGQDSVAILGATWSAWFFPTLPSLHGVMNGFLLVCGYSPSLKSILTKAQNTHPSRQAGQSMSSPPNAFDHESTCCWLTQPFSHREHFLSRTGVFIHLQESLFAGKRMLASYQNQSLAAKWTDWLIPDSGWLVTVNPGNY